MRSLFAVAGLMIVSGVALVQGADPNPDRGREALFTRAFVPAPWSPTAVDSAWKVWQPPLQEKPKNYDEAFRNHYGLHPAPFPNNNLPIYYNASADRLRGTREL